MIRGLICGIDFELCCGDIVGWICVGVVLVFVLWIYEVVLLWVCLLVIYVLKEVCIEGFVCWVEFGEFFV